MRCSALQCVAVRCSALQCIAVYCSMLQCVAAVVVLPSAAVRASVSTLAVAVCCSALQCVGDVPLNKSRTCSESRRSCTYTRFAHSMSGRRNPPFESMCWGTVRLFVMWVAGMRLALNLSRRVSHLSVNNHRHKYTRTYVYLYIYVYACISIYIYKYL